MGVLCALVVELFSKKGIVLAAGLLLGAFSCQMGILYEASQAVDHMDPLVPSCAPTSCFPPMSLPLCWGTRPGCWRRCLSHIYLLASPAPDQWKNGTIPGPHGLRHLVFFPGVYAGGDGFWGIWGNESWGRFWGWDPKENGALMIVLWQLTVLHVRKAGWLSSWLLHFSNVVGGVIIAFAWWGVNMLGVGLHSYGFTSGRDALDMFYWFEAVLCVLFIILHYRALRRVDVR